MFYQKFWDVIKKDFVAMFQAWWDGKLDLYRLNFAMLALIPKENDVRVMKKLTN
jgi:hypothetical protein